MPEVVKQEEKMSWPRMLLAIGFFTIVAGVVVGAATQGSPVARYVALAGLIPIVIAIVGFVVQSLGKARNGRQHA